MSILSILEESCDLIDVALETHTKGERQPAVPTRLLRPRDVPCRLPFVQLWRCGPGPRCDAQADFRGVLNPGGVLTMLETM